MLLRIVEIKNEKVRYLYLWTFKKTFETFRLVLNYLFQIVQG